MRKCTRVPIPMWVVAVAQLGSQHEPGDLDRRPRGSIRRTLGATMTIDDGTSGQAPYGGTVSSPRNEQRTRIRTHHLQRMKSEGHKWAMLTAYDFSTARLFDEAGIPVLLVGD